MQRKKILFIRVNISDIKTRDSMQPLIFAILDAHTPSHYEKIFIDDCVEDINFAIKADIVALSFGTYAAKRSYAIADKFKQNGAVIIMGGVHTSVMPNEALEHANSVVIGDAEPIWEQVLLDYEEGHLKPKYLAQHNSGELITKINRSVINANKYFPVNPVQWGRGCKHNCDFCSIKSFYPNQFLLRPLDDVIQEIKTLNNHVIFFVDDNIYYERDLFTRFLNRIKPLKKRWTCQISIDVVWDEKLVQLMKEAGCIVALMGIESFDISNLKKMNKQWNNKIDFTKVVEIFRKHGIMVYGTFIFGYDADHPETFSGTVKYAIKSKLFLANFNPLYPMPGTSLYNRLKEENRLEFNKWWLHPDFYYGRTMFKPLNMSAEELEEGCFKAKRSFNSYKSILSRLIANATSFRSIILYLSINLINRRGILRKQHIKPGLLK